MQEIKLQKYNLKSIKPGDCFLFYNRHWWALFSKAIAKISGQKYDHIAIVTYSYYNFITQKLHFNLAEARVLSGVTITRYTINFTDINGTFTLPKRFKDKLHDCWLLPVETLTSRQQTELIEFVNSKKREKYNFLGLLVPFFARLSKKFLNFIIKHKIFSYKNVINTKTEFCSEFVLQALIAIGYLKSKNIKNNILVTPAQIKEYLTLKQN
jgi:hypothetical protein